MGKREKVGGKSAKEFFFFVFLLVFCLLLGLFRSGATTREAEGVFVLSPRLALCLLRDRRAVRRSEVERTGFPRPDETDLAAVELLALLV